MKMTMRRNLPVVQRASGRYSLYMRELGRGVRQFFAVQNEAGDRVE